MTRLNVEELLTDIDAYRHDNNLTRRQIAERLNVSYHTLKKWFQKGNNRMNPSSANVEIIKEFLESQKASKTYSRNLWKRFLRWWETQHRYSTVRQLADEIGWDASNLSSFIHKREMPPQLVLDKIAEVIGLKRRSPGSVSQEAEERTRKIKYLSLILEEELRWFRDGSKEARDIFREKLNADDIGYISSLLTMLGDEEKFKRWLTFTTNRFGFFRKKGGQK